MMHWARWRGFSGEQGSAGHIAIVLHDFSTGGTERVAIRLANAWAEAGRRVTILSGGEDGPTRALVAPAVRVVPIAPRGHRGASRKALGRALAGMVEGLRPDVVVGPGNYHAPILQAMRAALPKLRPAIVCKLSNPLYRADRSRLGQALFIAGFRRTVRGFDALAAMSPALAAEATALLGDARIQVIGEPTLDGAPPLPRTRHRTGTILCVGRLTRQKNLALALQAFARLDVSHRLLILGEGEEYGTLCDLAERLGIADRVRFAGYVPDVRPYLPLADVLLCTSLYEGYPAALVEALNAGVPVVTTPCTMALPEIMLDPSFGLIADPDPDALAGALHAVIADRLQPARAPLAELVRRGQLHASAEAWLALLDHAVAARAGGKAQPAPHATVLFGAAWEGAPARMRA